MMAGKGRRILKVDLGTGATQEMPVPGSAEDRIGAIYWNGTTVLAGIDRGSGGLYTMRADAPVWQSIALSTTKNADVSVGRIVEHNGTVVACMLRSGLYVLDTALRRAEHRHQGIQGTSIATLHTSGTSQVVTSRTAGVYRFDACSTNVARVTAELPTGEGYATVVAGGVLYVSVGRVGLWKSTNTGQHWMRCRYPDSSAYIDRMDALGSHIVASARERSWISTDNGTSWSRFVVNGDTSILRWTAEQGEMANNTREERLDLQMVGTAKASYLRRGKQVVWERIVTPYSEETQHRFGNAVIRGSTILLGTKGAVLLSRDAGTTWRPIDIAPATFASYITVIDNVLYVVSDKGQLMSATLPQD